MGDIILESVRERAGTYESVWENVEECRSVREGAAGFGCVGACRSGLERAGACGTVRERKSIRVQDTF